MYVLRVKCERSWTTANIKKASKHDFVPPKPSKTPLKPQKIDVFDLCEGLVFEGFLRFGAPIFFLKKMKTSKTLHFQFFF